MPDINEDIIQDDGKDAPPADLTPEQIEPEFPDLDEADLARFDIDTGEA